jgi:hypothetical protein
MLLVDCWVQGANQYAVTDFGLAPHQGRILSVGIGTGVTVIEDVAELGINPYGITESGGELYVTALLAGQLLEIEEEEPPVAPELGDDLAVVNINTSSTVSILLDGLDGFIQPTFRTTIAKIDNFAPQGTISAIMAVAIKIIYQ